jgi:hypothetical protein
VAAVRLVRQRHQRQQIARARAQRRDTGRQRLVQGRSARGRAGAALFVRDQLAQEQRMALALGHQRQQPLLRDFLAQQSVGQRQGRAGLERAEREAHRAGEAAQRAQLLGAGRLELGLRAHGAQDHQRQLLCAREQAPQECEAFTIRPLQIVDHHQQLALRAELLEQGDEGLDSLLLARRRIGG